MAVRTRVMGTFDWAKVFEVNRDKTGPNNAWIETDGVTSIDVTMDEDNFEKFLATGSRLKPVDNGDGTHTVSFRRPFHNEAFSNYGGPPKVARVDGSPWSLETDGLIGNGSTGVVTFTVYDTAVGTGTRLESVQVIDHVKYESEYSAEPLFEDMSYLLHEAVEEDTPEPKKKAVDKKELVPDDELPF